MRARRLRPSPSLVISVIALIMAATGTAAALSQHKAASTAGPIKGKSAEGGLCNPNSAAFTNCVTLTMNLPHSGRVLLVADGSWYGDANAANGQCHLVSGGAQVGLEPNPGQSLGTHADGAHEGGLAITGVTPVLPAGMHTFKLDCLEATPDFALGSEDLSAVLLN